MSTRLSHYIDYNLMDILFYSHAFFFFLKHCVALLLWDLPSFVLGGFRSAHSTGQTIIPNMGDMQGRTSTTHLS